MYNYYIKNVINKILIIKITVSYYNFRGPHDKNQQ